MDIIKLIFGDPKGVSAKPTASAAVTTKSTTTPKKAKKITAYGSTKEQKDESLL